MKLTKMVAACAVAMACGAASAVTIDGIVLPGGLTFSTITLFEGEKLGTGNGNSYIDQAGEVLLGIGIVNQILDKNNNIVWKNGDNGRELTFVIDGFVAETVTTSVDIPNNEAIGRVGFSGGSVKLYSQAAGSLNTGALTQAAAVTSASLGNLFLDTSGSCDGFVFAVSGNCRTLSSRAITTAIFNPLLEASTNVTGQAFLDVVGAGGLAAAYFDTNTYGIPGDSADMKITSSGQLQDPGSVWGFRGTGEVQAFLIPTPGTLALAGLALVGVGALSQRRKVAAA